MVDASTIDDRASRILVVDDEEVVWDVVRNALERPGCYLVYAPDGEQALALAFAENFDLIIADKNLPGVTGLDVLRQARARDPLLSTLIITGYASRESAEEAMAIGIDDYLVKPFDINELRDKVAGLLERRRRRLELSQTPRRLPRSRSVLVCEPDSDTRRALLDGIRRLGHQARAVDKVGDILDLIRLRQADTLVCALEVLRRDTAGGCFLRSGLLVRPDVLLVVVAGERSLQDGVDAAGHGARKALYRHQVSGPEWVASQLEEILQSG